MEGQIIPKLIAFFERFPGIGPRQARRFVYFLAEEKPGDIENFSALLARFIKEISHCKSCFRVFSAEGRSALSGERRGDICSICAGARDKSKILVVEKDTDLENIERTGIYSGNRIARRYTFTCLYADRQLLYLFLKCETAKGTGCIG